MIVGVLVGVFVMVGVFVAVGVLLGVLVGVGVVQAAGSSGTAPIAHAFDAPNVHVIVTELAPGLVLPP
ncbi:MAG: hypothetical protein KGK07_17610, partial [Chloroflexota bacterium]|nr:hypothetical protein [Chloroflexota bacterium]